MHLQDRKMGQIEPSEECKLVIDNNTNGKNNIFNKIIKLFLDFIAMVILLLISCACLIILFAFPIYVIYNLAS